MSGPNLQDSRWAPRSSRSAYTPYLPVAASVAAPSSFTTTTTKPHSAFSTSIDDTRPRSLSPSKLQSTKKQAAPPPPQTKSQLDLSTRRSENLKFTKLLRRLRWKATSLLFSFHRVFRHMANETSTRGGPSYVNELDYAMPSLEAETMFKIDFFEFYVLLERVLVHLLGAFGCVVSAGYARDLGGVDGDGTRALDLAAAADAKPPGAERASILGDSRNVAGYAHRFHANVLAALDVEGTVLHGVLGEGRVRDYLGIAKEFRNRWKDAEEKGKSELDDGLIGSRYERLLRDLKLEAMLGEILLAVEKCRGLAEEELSRVEGKVVAGLQNGAGNGVGIGTGVGEGTMIEMEMDYDASPWEAVDDAMEMD